MRLPYWPFLFSLWTAFSNFAWSDETILHMGRPEVGQETAVTEETPSRAVDERKVWRFVRTYSRGNDDVSENIANGIYETAKMKFGVVIQQEKGQLSLWLELQPTLSTSELKGARNGARFGAQSAFFEKFHSYSPEEKAKALEEAKAQMDKRVAEWKADNDNQRSRLVKKLELSEEKMRELKAALAALTEEGGKTKAEHDENIARFNALIDKAVAAKKNPGKDERADNLPEPHLRKILAEEESKKSQFIATHEQKLAEQRESLADAEKDRDFNQRALVDVENARLPFSTEVIASSGTRRNLPSRNEFVPFTFADAEFAKSLAGEPSSSPKGKEMSATVYIGSIPTPTSGKERLEGAVTLGSGGGVYHYVPWSVDLTDGVVMSAAAAPAEKGGPIRMWQLIDVSVTNPDRTVVHNPSNLKLEKGFAEKVEPKTTTPAATRSIASGDIDGKK